MKRNPYPQHISSIVDFALHAHRVKLNWVIVSLDEEEWSKFSSEMLAFEKMKLKNFEQLSKRISNPMEKADLPTLLKVKEIIRLRKKHLVEYGIFPTLDYYLATIATVLSVNDMLDLPKALTSFQPYLPEALTSLQPFLLGIVKENRHLDFLILINSSQFSNESYDEKLTTLAHEALHIIAWVRNSKSSSFESIQGKAKRMVSDFKKQATRKRKKISMRHPEGTKIK